MDSQPGKDGSCLVYSLCFVCKERTDRLICLCCYAHQHCLPEWCYKSGFLSCPICKQPYPVVVERGELDWRASCSRAYLRHLCILLLVMVLAAVTVWQVIALSQESAVGPITLGIFCLILYICVKCLWKYTDVAWKVTNNAGLRVVVTSPEVATLSETVTLDQSSSSTIQI